MISSPSSCLSTPHYDGSNELVAFT